MKFFSSKRERQLWLWVALVLFAIYSTLGLTGKLAHLLRDPNLVTGLFLFGMILIAGMSIVYGLKFKPSGLEIGVALGIAAAYLMVFTRMAIPEERTHLIEYGIVALFIYEALKERAARGWNIRFPAWVAILLTTIAGTIDECIQYFLPNRVFDPQDILFNFLAAVMAIFSSVVLSWAKRKTMGTNGSENPLNKNTDQPPPKK